MRRCLIVLHRAAGWSYREIGRALRCGKSTVGQVVEHYLDFGLEGLVDQREDNGELKLTEDFLAQLIQVLRGRPLDYGYERPTWTRELLVAVMGKTTGWVVSLATMSRALAAVGARRGRPRPVVRCPWAEGRKRRRLAELKRLAGEPPHGELVFYVDEVDIHLNPKIGLDWMLPGSQREVLTPGQNQKRYLAGALEASAGGRIIWVEGERKTSALFVALLERLCGLYPEARVIHLILDNYKVHSSQQTRLALQRLGGRVRLQFLPPYCPNDNRIERRWEDLHANVTRNHVCKNMEQLMGNVRRYLRARNRKTATAARRPRRAA